VIKGSKVLIMGLAYKENVADIRESPARGIVEGLSGVSGFLGAGAVVVDVRGMIDAMAAEQMGFYYRRL